MAVRCPDCSTPMVRSHREGFSERVLLAPLVFLRPFRCRRCGFRGLRNTLHPERKGLLLFAVFLLAGTLLVQLVWIVRSRAPEHPGDGYQPRNLERQRLLEEQEER